MDYNKIIKVRKSQKMTIAELSRLTAINRISLSRFEKFDKNGNQKVSPTLKQLNRICNALGLKLIITID